MNCPNCGAVIKADDKFCGECGTSFETERQTMRSEPLVRISKSEFPYEIAGIVSAIISLLLLPPIFGIIAIYCGYKVYKEKSEGIGIGIMVVGVIFMVIGMIFGMLMWL